MNNLIKNIILAPFNLLYKISPELDLKILFIIKQGYKLNLQNPQSYNEKIQWIKLNEKNDLMPKCCDKYLVRQYVESKGLKDILNEIYWQGFNPKEIPFDSLPDKFVIKATHGSTFNIICKDKSKLDKKKTIKLCQKWLKHKFLPCYGEWFYGKEKPRIIVEKYLEQKESDQLYDYKIFCFNGKAKYIRFDSDRFENHKMDVYDISWNKLEGYSMGYPNSNKEIEKPKNLDKMIEIANVFSKDFKHVRVDLYNINGEIYFGEMTFTNGSGFDKFEPRAFDYKMGGELQL